MIRKFLIASVRRSAKKALIYIKNFSNLIGILYNSFDKISRNLFFLCSNLSHFITDI